MAVSRVAIPKKGEDGFTLLELLLVVSLLGILSLVTVPQGNRLLAAARLRHATGELVATIRELQAKAAVEERSYYIEFVYTLDHSRDGYLIRRLDDDGLLEPGGKFHLLPPGVSIAYNRLSPRNRVLWFHPSGSPSSGASIPLENRVGEALTVKVLAVTGRVRVVEE